MEWLIEKAELVGALIAFLSILTVLQRTAEYFSGERAEDQPDLPELKP